MSPSEASTDLYYQYLLHQMLQSTLKAVLRLYIHRKPKVKKPTFDEMKALARNYPNTDSGENEEHWQFILLGLAISYIQRRDELVDSNFEHLRVDKKEFDPYMSDFVRTKIEKTSANYLVGVVCEEYGEIINNNDLSALQTRMLNRIYRNTLQWITKIAQTVDGQYQLLNTFSTDDVSKIAAYRGAIVDDRLRYMTECKTVFFVFWIICGRLC